MKKTKSAYIADRTQYWSDNIPCAPTNIIEAQVKRDVEAAEAAGIEWDQEEIKLLAFDERHEVIRVESPGNGWFICYRFTPTNPEHPGKDWQKALMRELVRRYNECPEGVKPVWLVSLEQILEYAKSEHGKSQQGYFSPSGGGGRPLYELLEWLKKVTNISET